MQRYGNEGNTTKNERMMYIDYTKAVGILLIVFAHCIQWFSAMSKVNEYVIGFHVPLFFVISGCLGYYKDYDGVSFKTFFLKRAKSLLIPYVVFSVINSVIKLTVLCLKSALSFDTFSAEMKELLITGNGTVWFLLTLFAVEVVIFLYRKLVFADRYIARLFLAVICLLLPYLLPQGRALLIVAERILSGTGYYLVGWIFTDLLVKMGKKSTFYLGFFFFVIGTVIALIYPAQFCFFTGEFLRPVSSIAISVLCSVGIVFLTFSVENRLTGLVEKCLNYLGQNSLCIMLVHPIILNCFTFPLGGLMASLHSVGSVLGSLILFVSVVLIDIPFVYIVNRWFPWVLGRSKRRRTV